MKMLIQACVCKHAYQDEKYGKGMRLHTARTKNNAAKCICTVCGTEKGILGAPKK